MSRKSGDDRIGPESGEDALIRLCVDEGRSEAFAELMRRHHAKIHAVICRLVVDRHRAEDLTQETFLRAWRALGDFQGASGFYTWIYRIARNVVSSDGRRIAARPRIAASLDGDADEERGAIEVEDGRGDPLTRAAARERGDRLVAALDALPAEFKEMILLRDVEGHSYEEIAEMVEIPVGTVRSRLHRARMDLKARLDRGEAAEKGRA